MRKIVIVGGVAGGATAAARLRRLSEGYRIVLFERGEYISFANCGLPYYIGGVIRDRNRLLLQTASGMSKRFRIDLRPMTEVTAIHRDRKAVTAKDLRTGEEYEETYDVLILSPGARPILPPIEGMDRAKSVFTLRTIPDADRIKAYVEEEKSATAAIIGGGFIGLEMAENLVERGVKVSLVEMADQVLPPLDYEMASIVHDYMRKRGIRLHLGDGAKALDRGGRRLILRSGKTLEADMIILAVGVEPESELAREAGLELGVRGAIRVNRRLQTSDPDIYAIGDAVEVKDYIHGFPTHVPLAWPANRQGRLVADIIHGFDVQYAGTLGTAVVKFLGLTAATTGNNEKTLRRLGIPHEAVHVFPPSHASYYPNAAPLALKLIFDPKTGRIFGAQAVGEEGVDKRIDVIATAIKGGLTVRDLPDLELAYAPPYSSAKDPVNIAGYVASNILDRLVETLQWHELDDHLASGGILLDVRTPEEAARGGIGGAVHIPLDELRQRLAELPKDKTICVMCGVGLRAYLACRILTENGFRAINLDGGHRLYFYAKGGQS
ncbi:CoA-disulfide reductase [Planifilum fulgidum]|uniref:CoA-disulfide reductase n=1 Tax=Planifilum fulgidum TaxID=201973 RepID=A0A1I2KU50_9BACL|nr:FAD-dependent oxidoreductase [Planifilum fulgidum]SFF70534.1 CoA-disulfide reductase [Planifilum fulgidum]